MDIEMAKEKNSLIKQFLVINVALFAFILVVLPKNMLWAGVLEIVVLL